MSGEDVKQVIEDKYPLQDLINNCEALTGYKKEVAVGALSNCSEVELSKEEFKGKIKSFLNRKVK
jgi:hypothetical protein